MVTRIITGIVGIALAAFVIQTGGWVFAAVVLLLSLIGWHEFARAFAHNGQPASYFTGMIALIFMLGCAWMGSSDEFMAVATLTMLLVFAEAVLFHGRFSVESACISAAGIFYVGFAFSHLLLLRFWQDSQMLSSPVGDLSYGCALIWIMFLGTWSSDTFAYFTGSLLGRHKLCPSISPNKTVEGFLGGLIGTTAVVAALGMLLSLSLPHMAALGVCIALIATLGDLVESVIKRYTGIKDSGSIIPGHGGVLDRFDSVMFTAPFVYYFVQIIHLAG